MYGVYYIYNIEIVGICACKPAYFFEGKLSGERKNVYK